MEKEIEVNPLSQAHVLRHRMAEKKLTHGETVLADIAPVQVIREGYVINARAFMYFCPMQPINILERLSPGDGETLPETATVEGIKAPETDGYYILRNVKLSSNGTMQVIATEQTVWEKVTLEERTVISEPWGSTERRLQEAREGLLGMIRNEFAAIRSDE